MKLNKVMALALSGLMAVSMLAGCSNGTPNGEENNQGQVTTTNAAEIMNSLQSKVEFKADSAMDAAFAAAMDSLESADISDAPAALAQLTRGDVYTAVQNKLPGSYKLSTTINYTTQPTNKADITTTVLYWVKAANLSEESVLTLVANTMKMDDYSDQGYTGTNPNYSHYELNYDGAVSIEKVTKTSESGTTYNAYVVAVSITRSYGDQVKI